MAKSFNLAATDYHEKPQRLDSDALHQWGLSGFQTQRAIFTRWRFKGIPNSFKSLEVSGVLGIEGRFHFD